VQRVTKTPSQQTNELSVVVHTWSTSYTGGIRRKRIMVEISPGENHEALFEK
jgi:hypothetical protein